MPVLCAGGAAGAERKLVGVGAYADIIIAIFNVYVFVPGLLVIVYRSFCYDPWGEKVVVQSTVERFVMASRLQIAFCNVRFYELHVRR